MEKTISDYKVVTADSSTDLTNKVTQLIREDWSPLGSHQVLIKHVQNRFSGNVHKDTINELEYTQTMVKYYDPTR